ncbi:pre-peptidase C-terminal domain-containing protein [Leptolyngbya ohadii]|uniref:pre-peptidase C-terminal domain-containing protein n=1 Tax=Leptolyngbya ohadii TaxID=1962290 RepID=UPI000B59B731|nr:pre-peptidase C-terminal domain-containing protein [Leptolyngbya ohadii]
MSNLGRIIRDILDNESNGARDLGALTETRTVQGSLSSRGKDFNDFYKFRLRARSSASVAVSEFQRNVDLRLLNENGKVVATSQNPDREEDAIGRTLEAGLYFVQVRWGRGSKNSRGNRASQGINRTRYSLTVSPSLSAAPPDPNSPEGQVSAVTPPDLGNTIPSAFNVGDLTGDRLYRATVGGTDTADYYRFNLTRTSIFRARTQNVTDGNVQLELIYDANGNGVVDASELLEKTDSIETPLGAGSYLLGITPQPAGARRTTNYELFFGSEAVTDLNPTNDPGEIPGTAFDLGSLNGSVSLKQFVGTVDLRDTYRFSLNDISGVGVSLSGLAGEGRFSLVYDINDNGLIDAGDPLIWDAEGSNFAASQVKTLLAGGYFVEVARQNPQSNALYNLNLTATRVSGLNPIPDPGAGLGTATDIGNLTSTTTGRPRSEVKLRQVIGSRDSIDVYRFELTDQVNTFKATLNASGLSDDVTMALIYDRDGDNFMDLGERVGDRVIPGDFIGGTFLSPGQEDKAAIEKTLGAGTYFLVVTQKETVENTVYDLNVFAQGLTGTYAAPDPVTSGPEALFGSYLGQATPLQINGTTYSQFVGSTDAKDVYRFTIDGTTSQNMVVKLAGITDKVEVRFARDLNGNGMIDFAVDSAGDVLPEFDTNGNGKLDQDEGEVFQPSLGKYFGTAPDVIYSPLPPYYDAAPFFNLPIDNGWVTSVATDIYAQLDPGTYYIEIERAGFDADLGDGRSRTGYSNAAYTLTLLPA